MSTRKIIFAGLGRDVMPFLEGVTANIETFAKNAGAWAVLVAENDSVDASRAALKSWMDKAKGQGAVQARLIELDGLAARYPVRTERIAAARNAILQDIENDSVLRDFDYLVLLDMDFPNSRIQPPENSARAFSFLEEHADVAGVFANSLPFYYDIWALREKTWCPGDCWDDVAAAPDEKTGKALHVHARQIFLDPLRDPIEVESAFGGLAIYRLKSVLGRRYDGLKPDGGEICEHVAFHAAIRRDGGRLFILPDFHNLAGFEHTNLWDTHAMLTVGGRVSLLLTHDAAARRKHFPRGGYAFGQLAALYGASGGAILDLAPQGGVNFAMARLAGCAAPYICAEGDEREFAVLSANALMQSGIFTARRLLQAGPMAALSLAAKEAGLIRLGTGNDAALLKRGMAHLAHQPVLWARIESPDEAMAWEESLNQLPYESVMALNSLGTVIASGPLADQKQRLASLFQKLPHSGGGFDLVFFPQSADALFRSFLG